MSLEDQVYGFKKFTFCSRQERGDIQRYRQDCQIFELSYYQGAPGVACEKSYHLF